MEFSEIIEAINKLSQHDWFDYCTLLLTLAATVINIWLVNMNTNKQIKNQNKETYRPRLKLNNIEVVEHNLDKYYLYAYSKHYNEESDSITLYVDIILENIGNGLANDISFYMLNSGQKCLGMQVENQDTNQSVGSTLEIPKDKKETFKFLFKFDRKSFEKEPSDLDRGDFLLLICNYKDLNDNNYKILIGYDLKKYEPYKFELNDKGNIEKFFTDGKFNMYYYQQETRQYKGMIEKNVDNYKKIIKDIKKNN